MRNGWILLAIALIMSGCTNPESPLAPTAVAGPTPPVLVPSLPTSVPGVLSIGMPIDAADAATTSFGLEPFGHHGAVYAEEGHPGWDVEYRIGGIVRAAADGTVQSVFPDASTRGRRSGDRRRRKRRLRVGAA